MCSGNVDLITQWPPFVCCNPTVTAWNKYGFETNEYFLLRVVYQESGFRRTMLNMMMSLCWVELKSPMNIYWGIWPPLESIMGKTNGTFRTGCWHMTWL